MDSSDISPGDYQLGPFKVRGKENILVTGQDEIVLLPKVMAMLQYFCRHPQKVVTFDELNNAIWPHEVVGDNAIYNLIGQLRKVLGDSAKKPTYIQTVSKVGYRLLVNTVPLEQDIPRSTVIDEPIPTKKQPSAKMWLMGLSVALLLLVFAKVFLLPAQPERQSFAAERQLKLARYQLNRGDPAGVEQAIQTLQQLITTDSQNPIPQVELAYAFLRKAWMEPGNSAFWLAKAKAIGANKALGKRGERLALLVSAIDSPPGELSKLDQLFSVSSSVLSSARSAYGQLLLDAGLFRQASTQLKSALETCLDCPYLYRRFAASQIVLGDIQGGFDSFAHYRMLLNRQSNNPSDNAGYVPLTRDNLVEMARWHYQHPLPINLQAYQRNTLALFYLSLERIDAAEAIVATSAANSTRFFDLYTQAAIAGARGDFATSFTLLKKRQMLYPENDRFRLSVIYALWQLQRFEEALVAFNELEEGGLPDELPNSLLSFSSWSVYAALLVETGDAERGQQILSVLEKQLRAGIVPGSDSADIRLASVLALQGREQEALDELEAAITQGWVSDFNQNWWYIEDSPYFQGLNDNKRFKQLVTTYHQRIASELQEISQPD